MYVFFPISELFKLNNIHSIQKVCFNISWPLNTHYEELIVFVTTVHWLPSPRRLHNKSQHRCSFQSFPCYKQRTWRYRNFPFLKHSIFLYNYFNKTWGIFWLLTCKLNLFHFLLFFHWVGCPKSQGLSLLIWKIHIKI